MQSIFYDKTIIIYTTEGTTDDVGWTRKAGTTVQSGTFKANVNFDKLDEVQMEYGLMEQIDIKITTNTNIEEDTIIGFNNIQYKVYRVFPFDTHYLIFGQKWSSRSLTSISA